MRIDDCVGKKVQIQEVIGGPHGEVCMREQEGILLSAEGTLICVDVKEFLIGGRVMEPTQARLGPRFFNTMASTFAFLKPIN